MKKLRTWWPYAAALLLVCLCYPQGGFAQGGVINGPIQIQGPNGAPLPGATVTFCTSAGAGFPCSPLASIFTDAGLTIAAANPTVTDGLGNLPQVFAAPGVYKISVVRAGITSQLLTASVAGTGGGNAVLNQINLWTADNLFKSGRPWYDVRAFGAVGNDSTNDITSLQAAADLACVSGGTVYVPFGTYKILTTWKFPSLTSLAPCSNVTILFAPGATLHFTPTCPCVSGANGSAIITGTGPSSDRPISGNITAGTTSFVATSAGSTADLVANNWLLVTLIDPVLLDAVNIDFVQVASVAGTTVNLKQPFQTSFAPSGGQTLVFQNMNANTPNGIQENFSIRGGGIIKTDLAGQSVGSAVVNGLLLYWTKGAWITDTTFITIPGNGTAGFVSQFRSQGAHIVHNRFVGQGSATQNLAAEQAESVDWEFSDNVMESENTSTIGPYLHIDFGASRFSVIGNKLNNGGANGAACYICAETGIHDGIIANNEIGLMAGQEKAISLLGAKNVTIAGNTMLGPLTSGFAGSLGINLGTDTSSTPNITSANNIVSHNRVGTVNAFQTPYQVAATDLIFQDDGSGNAKINHTLSVGGGTALATSNQSGTGSICMTTSCALTTPTISGAVPSYNSITTAGQGFPVIQCITSQKSESAADANVLTCTPAAAAGNYRIGFVLSLSAANAATLGWTATWTDSNGNAQAPTNLSLSQSGAAAPALTFTTSAAGNYYGYADIDVNNAGTNIVIKLTFSGTSFTGKATATVERII